MTLELAGFTLYRRNNLAGKIGLCLIIFAAMSFVCACDVNWVSQATAIINVLVPAIEGALGLFLSFGVGLPPQLAAQIQQAASEAIAALQNVVLPLLKDYNSSTGDQQTTIVQKIEAALQDIAGKFPSILSALHIDNPATQAKLTAVFSSIQSEILALINIIPVVQGKTSLAAFEASGGRVPLNAGQFKHAHSAIFKAKTGDTSVDKIVEHAKVFEKKVA